ncbi:ubiquitin-conjugating enzyme E2 D4-like [Sycon ciliatum]|uniref:ubiquitin-conjugating enzyme E2 D4-like n=1 Tax=Sycon ciliatum TaxID=27933 RepID=UPI0031F6A250
MADGAWISAETEDEIYDRALVLVRKADIRNEFERLERNPPDGCYIKANHDDDFLFWEATVFGPKGSPYEGGVFDITLKCKEENPFVWPDVTFITKIYHPIIKRHSKICEWCLLRNVDADNSGPWHKGIIRLFETIQNLLNDPYSCPSHSTGEVGNGHQIDPDLFAQAAKEWTRRYAQEYKQQQASG